jgi:hypothetical protein
MLHLGRAAWRLLAGGQEVAMKPAVLVAFERLQPMVRPVCITCTQVLAALLLGGYLSFVLRGFPLDW